MSEYGLKTGKTGPLTNNELRDSPVPVSGAVTVTEGIEISTPSPAMPAGGVGVRGWLSAIWTKLNASLAVTGTFWQTTQPVSISQATPGTTNAVALKDASNNTVTFAPRSQTPTGNVIQVQIGPGDIISSIPITMDFAQHQIHEGEQHSYGYYATSVSTISFALTVPVYANTIQAPHLIMHADVYEGSAEISLWEGITYTGGSAVTIYNRNRNSLTTPGMTIKSGVTITGAGTRLPYSAFISGSVKSAGASRGIDEVVLKSNTVYGVIFEEITAVSRVILHFEWYEDLGV